jgi:hypothetical protein
VSLYMPRVRMGGVRNGLRVTSIRTGTAAKEMEFKTGQFEKMIWHDCRLCGVILVSSFWRARFIVIAMSPAFSPYTWSRTTIFLAGVQSSPGTEPGCNLTIHAALLRRINQEFRVLGIRSDNTASVSAQGSAAMTSSYIY